MRKTSSPSKGYGAVKSKVAGNMRSIKKSQTRTAMQRAIQQDQYPEHNFPKRAKTYASPKKARKSAAPSTNHDQIISEIKSKYSKEAINEMS